MLYHVPTGGVDASKLVVTAAESVMVARMTPVPEHGVKRNLLWSAPPVDIVNPTWFVVVPSIRYQAETVMGTLIVELNVHSRNVAVVLSVCLAANAGSISNARIATRDFMVWASMPATTTEGQSRS